jgi:pyruvate dehydrogenase complex dehydrogenase (E1) component
MLLSFHSQYYLELTTVECTGFLSTGREGMFRGAGWNVLKVIWGGEWDKLLEKDTTGLLKKALQVAINHKNQIIQFFTTGY